MRKEEYSSKLSEEESKIVSYWKDIVEYVKRDLAYIWTEKVRRDFKGIKKEVLKIQND